MVESNTSFDYTIPKYVCRPLQAVYPPQGFQDMACISISGPPHPSPPSTRCVNTAMHHALELPAAYSQMEVTLWPRNEIYLWPRNEIIYTDGSARDTGSVGTSDIQTTTGVLQVFSGLNPVLHRGWSFVLTRLTTIQELQTLFRELNWLASTKHYRSIMLAPIS